MVDTKTIKEFVIQSVELGYDVHDVILLARTIQKEDDISNALQSLRLQGETRDCYYKTISIDEVIDIIEKDVKGTTKISLINSLERKLKNIV